MMRDIEDIIAEKEFYELTPEEKQEVLELAENELEYNNLKWFLKETKKAVNDEKIQASEKLTHRVLGNLSVVSANNINSNGSEKKDKKKIFMLPIVQIAVAAVLVIGIFMITNPFGNDDEQLALNKNAAQNVTPLVNEPEENDDNGDVTAEVIEQEMLEETTNETPIHVNGSVNNREKKPGLNDFSDEAPIVSNNNIEIMEISVEEDGNSDNAKIAKNINMDERFDEEDDISIVEEIPAVSLKNYSPVSKSNKENMEMDVDLEQSFNNYGAARAEKNKKILQKEERKDIPGMHISIAESPELTTLFFTVP